MSTSPFSSEIKSAMLLSQLESESRRAAYELFMAGSSLSEITQKWIHQNRSDLRALLEKFNPENEIEKCTQKKIEIISIADSNYPETLRSISDPPFLIYALGDTSLLHDLSVAVVGSREASFYGVDQARRFARSLADAGLTVVSGLARGIDQVAHEAALDTEGRTIAVLGCGMDVIYPPENRDLYQRIIKSGLIISEYPLGAEPRAYHFPRRNRILSGLCLGVLVVEAHERSGSLITAYQALEQGREVFAIPGPVHHITSRGAHRLIREGAALVESPEEIIALLSESSGMLQFQTEKKETRKWSSNIAEIVRSDELKPKEEVCSNPILKILKNQNPDYEGLMELSGLAPHDFAQTLTELEIEGKVRRNAAGYFEIG